VEPQVVSCAHLANLLLRMASSRATVPVPEELAALLVLPLVMFVPLVESVKRME